MGKSNTRNILLLTATITPKSGVPNLTRVDPKLRLRDYHEALEFYLSLLSKGCDGIIFAENSNSDVSSLQKLVEKHSATEQVEFIVFDGLDYPVNYDRGYGEFKLIDYAMKQSKMVSTGVDKIIIWKITGRYLVRNLDQIIAHQPYNFDIYANFRNYPKCWVDTFLMAWTPQAYQIGLNEVYHRLKTNIPEVPEGMAAEELLRNWLDQQPKTLKFKRRFNVTPQVDGKRGADNKGYSTDNWWKFSLRSMLNMLFPWLWV